MANGNKKYPTHRAYTVTERKGSWREIGAAWPHDDGMGFTLKLDALPVHGEIVLRIPTEKEGPAAPE